jgi:exonuclease III
MNTRLRQKKLPGQTRNTGLTLGTWKVQTMMQTGKMMAIAGEVLKLGIDLVALQEIRWEGQGEINKKHFIVIYSGPENRTGRYGTGFIISRKIKEGILECEPVNDRLCRIQIRGKLRNLTVISAHAPQRRQRRGRKSRILQQA